MTRISEISEMKDYRRELIELFYEYGFCASSWEDNWSYDGIGQFLTIKDSMKIVELPTEFECDLKGNLAIKAYKTKYLAHKSRYPLSWTTILKFRYDQEADIEKMKAHIQFLKKNLKDARLDCEKWQITSRKIQHMEEIETASEEWET